MSTITNPPEQQQPQPQPSPHQTDETLTFPPASAALIEPYLPPSLSPSSSDSHTAPVRPHVTLTYAHSLDASLALAPGVRTALSGPMSKAMTHYLRARHDAILVGAGTAVADDPGLNSRLVGAAVPTGQDGGGGADGGGDEKADGSKWGQPRPIVLDPQARWAVSEESKVVRVAREGKGLGPFVLVAPGAAVPGERRRALEAVGGRYIVMEARATGGRFDWADVLAVVQREGLGSVMIEGGGEVINSLLAPPANELVDSVIVTIAPTWLGQGGVVVSPPRTTGPSLRLTDVAWCPLGEDVVLCGRIQRATSAA